MEYKIRDIRNNPELKKERDSEELAHKLLEMSILCNVPIRQVGGVIKKLKHMFDFSNLKSEHTQNDRIVGK